MLCAFCGEEIREGERANLIQGGDLHHECAMRSILGSVGHQLHKCPCYGGTEEDPPGMTKRQAAMAAVELWEAGQGLLSFAA